MPAVLQQVLFLKPNFPVCNVPDACRRQGAEINRTSGMSWDYILLGFTVLWTLGWNLWRVSRRKRALWPFPVISRWHVQTVHICSMQVGSWRKLRGALFLGEGLAAHFSTYRCKSLPDLIPEREGKQLQNPKRGTLDRILKQAAERSWTSLPNKQYDLLHKYLNFKPAYIYAFLYFHFPFSFFQFQNSSFKRNAEPFFRKGLRRSGSRIHFVSFLSPNGPLGVGHDRDKREKLRGIFWALPLGPLQSRSSQNSLLHFLHSVLFM